MGRMRTFGFNDYINIFNMNILIRIEKKEKKIVSTATKLVQNVF